VTTATPTGWLGWRWFLLSPKGRVTRFEYWACFLVPAMMLGIVLALANHALGGGSWTATLILVTLAYPYTVVAIKRLHDQNRRGWWVLLAPVPFIGAVALPFILGLLRGTAGENRFGSDRGDRAVSRLREGGFAVGAVFFSALTFGPELLFSTYNIPSAAMQPTLLVGDMVYVSKFPYGYSRFALPIDTPGLAGRVFGHMPERGDIVVFKLPKDNSTDFIKRVVGLPDERIHVRGGILHINGQPVKRERIEDFERRDSFGNTTRLAQYIETLPNGRQHRIVEFSDRAAMDDTQVYQVPKDHFFVMGDNRDNSQDSRYLAEVGYVPMENLIGRADVLQRGFSFRWVR